ncbi:MAG: dihydrofolate reductase family protein [Anaerolineae bacterium]|nr:dihydrofolate reductase family protein [Anaerolineae bacterium]
MQELLVDFITSLDGYGTATGWPGWWGLEGPEYLKWLGEQPDYTLLMGANTYHEMYEFTAQSDLPSEEADSMDGLTKASKVVFSSTLKAPLPWANTQLISGDAVEAVRKMKQEGNKPLTTLGSISLARSLLKAGLVDRFRVIVFPVITGRTGTGRIYDDYPDVAFDMVSTRIFDGKIQLLEGVPRLLTAPPGMNDAP